MLFKMLIPGAEYLVFLFILGKVLSNACPDLAQITATEVPQYITSPNFPGAYPRSSSCKWIIQSHLEGGRVNIRIVNFSLDTSVYCYADHLEVRDGSYRLSSKIFAWCGKKSTNRVYRTTQRHAYVSFQAVSRGLDASGFVLQFWSTVKDPVQKGQTRLTIAHYILAGFSALILLFFIVGLTIITCIRGYRDFQKKNRIMIFLT